MLINWSWLPDDSGIVTTIQDVAAVGDPHILTKINADGSGKTDYSPQRTLPVATADFRPVVFRAGTRIYFPEIDPATSLSSIKLDGSDHRTDFSGTSAGPGGSFVTFHGFKGDTLN